MQTTIASQIQLILGDSFQFATRNFYQIVTLCLPFILIVMVFDLLLMTATDVSSVAVFGRFAIEPLVYAVYMAALIHFMAKQAKQEAPTNSELVLLAVRQWGAFLALRIMEIFLVLLGLQLLILPAIWLVVRLAYAEFYLVLYGANPIEAIRQSFIHTRRHFWLILAMLMMIWIPIILVLGLVIGTDVQMLVTNSSLRISLNMIALVFEIFVRIILFRTFMEAVAEQGEAQ